MAGGSSGGHGFGVPNNGRKKEELRMKTQVEAGSKEALANDLQRLGRNEQHSRQRISYNTNQRQAIRNERPKMEMHRMERTDQRMTQTTRDNRTILEDAFRKQRRNKT